MKEKCPNRQVGCAGCGDGYQHTKPLTRVMVREEIPFFLELLENKVRNLSDREESDRDEAAQPFGHKFVQHWASAH
jgi:hypothetical protein